MSPICWSRLRDHAFLYMRWIPLPFTEDSCWIIKVCSSLMASDSLQLGDAFRSPEAEVGMNVERGMKIRSKCCTIIIPRWDCKQVCFLLGTPCNAACFLWVWCRQLMKNLCNFIVCLANQYRWVWLSSFYFLTITWYFPSGKLQIYDLRNRQCFAETLLWEKFVLVQRASGSSGPPGTH